MVVDVVRRCDFKAACTEFDVNIFIFNYRNLATNQRNYYMLSTQMLVLRVVRVDTHCRIAHYCFRTCSSYNGVCAWVFNDSITQIEEFAVFFLVYNLFIAKCRLCLRVPVDHTGTTIDKSFIIKFAEYMNDTLASCFVHSERSSVPIATGT